ncbi:MAG: GNAT family N-acetyltransferase [Candidatus Dadabacteria bacterium]|nr:GNAT family N-acetyltransferase [Candidatus Dadabacteria bacterium]
MKKVESARGVTVSFRLVEEADAEFIVRLRTDPELGRYLFPTDPSVQKQREWLADYKKREADGVEYYYIIFRNEDEKRCGTVRLFIEEDHFEWGSLILNGDKTPTSSIEMALFICQAGFEVFGFQKASCKVHKDNLPSIKFHAKMNARIVGEVETGVGMERLYEMNLEDWEKLRQKFKPLLVKELN